MTVETRVESYRGKFIESLKIESTGALDKAARYLVKALKEELDHEIAGLKGDKQHSSPGHPPYKMSGDLQKGIGWKYNSDFTREVGAHSPAYHFHLLEFGTVERETNRRRNGKIKNSKATGHSTGRMEARPFFFRTCDAEKEAMKEILAKGIRQANV